MIEFTVNFSEVELKLNYKELTVLYCILLKNGIDFDIFRANKPIKDLSMARMEVLKTTDYSSDGNPFLNK